MAWLEQEKTGIYQICFRFGDERVKKSARTRDERKALSIKGRVEENIELIQRGRLSVPEDVDLFAFLISDGNLNGEKQKKRKSLTLSALFPRYRDSLPPNALSQETLRITEVHMRHVVRILGARGQLRTVKRDDLQHYINERSKESGKRNRSVSPGTIKKELATFRTLWRWAVQSEYVSTVFPNEGLRYPRERQKLPFMTWDQIEQRIERGIPKGETEADYWDCVYLNASELGDLLEFIREASAYRFLYPMAYIAAHTGARRSELCRSVRDDIDFENL